MKYYVLIARHVIDNESLAYLQKRGYLVSKNLNTGDIYAVKETRNKKVKDILNEVYPVVGVDVVIIKQASEYTFRTYEFEIEKKIPVIKLPNGDYRFGYKGNKLTRFIFKLVRLLGKIV